MHFGILMTTGTRHAAPVGARRALALPFLVTAALALTALPAAAQSACGASYTFDSGDTLAEVAQRCGVTLPALLAANPGVVDDQDIDVGSRLRVPDPGADQPSPVVACGAYYTLRPGDSLVEIAAKCGVTIPMLVAANPPFPSPLGNHAGLKVRIPHVSAAAARDPGTIVVAPRTPAAAAVEAAAAGAVSGAPAASDESTQPDSAAIAADELVRVEGVLEEGERCMGVRGPDGELHSISGELRGDFQAGDRVVLLGVPAEEHSCGGSWAVELRILYRAGV